jgi:DivIVA domain-containing protein
MSTVDLDRQQIERRDFPIVRRGYDPASVDTHLRALAAEIEELASRASSGGAGESLAAVAGSQVQGILEAAQATAETIEREAAADAQRLRAAATEDARRTREEAIAKAQGHVVAVSEATDALLARVGSMDSETQTLIESLRSGATRLAGDLTTVEMNMESLYDAASGRGGVAAVSQAQPEQVQSEPVTIGPYAPPPASQQAAATLQQAANSQQATPQQVAAAQQTAAAQPATPVQESPVYEQPAQQPPVAETVPVPSPATEDAYVEGEPGAQSEQPWEPPSAFAEDEIDEGEEPLGAEQPGDDLDGPRLVALNGDSREATGRYLEENFEMADRERLLDEVYAAIEG